MPAVPEVARGNASPETEPTATMRDHRRCRLARRLASFYLCSDALYANRGRAVRRPDMSVQLTTADAGLPKNWLVHGPALETRRRRSGADAQRGFDYQRAFAVWKIAQLLNDANGIVGVRYEGAQDVDLLMADGRVVFVQLHRRREPTERVYHCQNAQLRSRGKLVMDEVHGPYFI